MIELSNQCNPILCVGYVAHDINFQHIKFKSGQFVSLRKLCYSIDDEKRVKKLILEIVRINDFQDFLNVFPQWKYFYFNLRSYFLSICEKLDELFQSLDHLDSIQFAKSVKKFKFYGILFDLRKSKVSSRVYFSSIRTDTLLTFIDQFEKYQQK